jgi:phosphatidylserine decarboxylase
MRIHKEGHSIILPTLIALVAITTGLFMLVPGCYIFSYGFLAFSILVMVMLGIFFNKPNRDVITDEKIVYSPAEGKIVVIEETEETEFFNDQRIQVSIFMSIWNAHINWIPLSGTVIYYKYHQGKYFLARNPKSSEENERTSTVIETSEKYRLLIRQIAGAVARRIVSYVSPGQYVKQGQELGFIKFGSRVDLFFPLDAKIEVDVGQKVRGNKTILARLKDSREDS